MHAVETYNAEMGLEAPGMPQDRPTAAGPTERPIRRRKSKATGPTDA
jgi:hypothetical protein